MGPTKEEWESHRDTIYRIYMNDGKTLKDLMTVMQEQHNFSATRRQYEYKIKQWGMTKNLTPGNWKAIDRRMRQFPMATTVVVGGRKLSSVKVQRNIRRHALMTAYDFMYPSSMAIHRNVILRPPSPANLPQLSMETRSLPWFEFRQSAMKGIWAAILTSASLPSASKDWVSEISTLIQRYDDRCNPRAGILPTEAHFITANDNTGIVSTFWERVTPAEFLSGTERLLYRMANNITSGSDTNAICSLLKHQRLAKTLIEALVTSEHPVARAIVEYLASASLHRGEGDLFTALQDSMSDSETLELKYITGCSVARPGRSAVDVAIGHCNYELASALLDAGHSIRKDWTNLLSRIFDARCCGGPRSDLETSALLRWLLEVGPDQKREELVSLGMIAFWEGYRDSAAVILQWLSNSLRSNGVTESLELLVLARACEDDASATYATHSVSTRMALTHGVEMESYQAKLHWAVCELILMGKIQLGSPIFDWGYRVNEIHSRDSNSRRPHPHALQVAAYQDDPYAVELLLSHGADPTLYFPYSPVRIIGPRTTHFGHSALQSAILGQSVDSALYLLRNGAKAFGGELHMAIDRNLLPVVKELVNLGARVDDINYYDPSMPSVVPFLDSPLRRALLCDQDEIVGILESETAMEGASSYDPEALCAAVATGSVDIISRMLCLRREVREAMGENAADYCHPSVPKWEGLTLLLAAIWSMPVFDFLLRNMLPLPQRTFILFPFPPGWKRERTAREQLRYTVRMMAEVDWEQNADLLAVAIRLPVSVPHIRILLDNGALVTAESICAAAESRRVDLLQEFLRRQNSCQMPPGSGDKPKPFPFKAKSEPAEKYARFVIRALRILFKDHDSRCLELFLSFEITKEILKKPRGGALLAAVFSGDTRLIEHLLSNMNGLTVNLVLPVVQGRLSFDTILEYAAWQGRLDIASFILDKGFNTGGEARRHFVNAVRLAQRRAHFALGSLLKSRRGWTQLDENMLSTFEKREKSILSKGMRVGLRCCDIDSLPNASNVSESNFAGTEDKDIRACELNVGPEADEPSFDAWLSSLVSTAYEPQSISSLAGFDTTPPTNTPMPPDASPENVTGVEPTGVPRTEAGEGLPCTALVGPDPMLDVDAVVEEDIELAEQMSKMGVGTLSRISGGEYLPMDETESMFNDHLWLEDSVGDGVMDYEETIWTTGGAPLFGDFMAVEELEFHL